MALLGKSLVFYLKYWTEMERLCASESSDLEGLPNPETTREMAQQVETKACSQVADFLEALVPGIEEHFKSIGQCRRRTSRGIVERKWSIEFSIWPKYKRSPARPKMTAGVGFQRSEKAEVIPWIWRHGGDEAEKVLEHILGPRAKVRSRELGWEAGTIGLDRIQVMPEVLNDFDLIRDPLMDQIQQALGVFGNQDLEALWPK